MKSDIKYHTIAPGTPVTVPLVVVSQIIDGQSQYIGFVPGYEEINIVCPDRLKCKTLLRAEARRLTLDKIARQDEFPFFPSESSIRRDFDDIVSIDFVTIR